MIGLYRILPSNFKINNFRTFASLVWNGKEIGSYHDGQIDKKGPCKLVGFHDKSVRVLLISNPQMDRTVHCSMRLGAGSLHDDGQLPGIAHLLERIISKWAVPNCRTSTGYTNERDTVYTFEQDNEKEFWKWFGGLTNVMFSPQSLAEIITDNYNERVTRECNCINAEFHGKTEFAENAEFSTSVGLNLKNPDFVETAGLHGNAAFLLRKTREILNYAKILTPSSSAGCLESLGGVQNLTSIKNGLEAMRELYRTRPAFVCIYSNQTLDAALNSFLTNSWISQETSTGVSKSLPTGGTTDRVLSTTTGRLLGVESYVDSNALLIIFPIGRQLQTQQVNVMEFLEYFFKYEGCLTRLLFAKKLATEVKAKQTGIGFNVHVELTETGLTDCRLVADIVLAYIEYLLGNWTQLTDWVAKHSEDWSVDFHGTGSKFVEIIANKFEYSNTSFNERDFYLHSDDADVAKKFISDLTTNLDDVLYVISTRDIDTKIFQKYQIEDPSAPDKQTEPYYNTKFSVFTKRQFPDSQKRATDPDFYAFGIQQLDSIGKVQLLYARRQTNNYSFHAVIDGEMDRMVQELALKYLYLWSFGFLTMYNVKFPGKYKFYKDDGNIYYGSELHSLHPAINTYLNGLTPAPLNDDRDYKILMDYSNRKLSEQMNDPLQFARSLLNINLESRCSEVPTFTPAYEYVFLRGLPREDYNQWIGPMIGRRKPKRANDGRDVIAFDQTFTIESINKSERSTATVYFYRLDGHLPEYVRELKQHFQHELWSTFRTELGVHIANCRDYTRPRELPRPIVDWSTIGKGIIVEIQSVEDVAGQSGAEIAKKWQEVLDKNAALTQQLCADPLKTHKMCIQIIGHAKATMSASDEPTSFHKDFAAWYKKNREDFSELCYLEKCKEAWYAACNAARQSGR